MLNKLIILVVGLCGYAAVAGADHDGGNDRRGDFYTDFYADNVLSLPELSLSALRRLARSGNLAAQYELGYRLERGDGVAPHRFRAYVWYHLAAARGHAAAARARNDIGRYLPAREIARAQRRARRLWADAGERPRDDRYASPAAVDRAVIAPPRRSRQAPPPRTGAIDDSVDIDDVDIDDIDVAIGADDVNFDADAIDGINVNTADAADTAPLDAESLTLIQRALSRLGYRPGPADGRIGPRTRAAVLAYQRDHRLRADGRPSRPLMDHLAARLQAEIDADAPRYSARADG